MNIILYVLIFIDSQKLGGTILALKYKLQKNENTFFLINKAFCRVAQKCNTLRFALDDKEEQVVNTRISGNFYLRSKKLITRKTNGKNQN